jgi:hypothetical protein
MRKEHPLSDHAEDRKRQVERLKERMLKRSFFVMFRQLLDPSKLPDQMLAHYQWIIGLEKRGLVFASGPLFKPDGAAGVGMTVFRVSDFKEAAALAGSDPFCISGATSYELKRWQINEGRVSLSMDFSDQQSRFD